MAEEFLEKIYKEAEILELVSEAAQDSHRMLVELASVHWNQAVPGIQRMGEQLIDSDPEEGKLLMEAAGAVADAWGNASGFAACINSVLLPALWKYLRHYTGISVTESRYTLCSADSGFLTVLDEKRKQYLHDPHDPMWEAHVLAEAIYRPEMEEFHLFGVGLGYLAYQLYRISGGAMRIILYEKEEEMIRYAFSYGVLEWIPEEVLSVLSSDDPEELMTEFMHRTKNSSGSCIGRFISEWSGIEYRELGLSELDHIRIVGDASRWFYDQWKVNFRKNKKRANIGLKELGAKLKSEEWVVVAAGPSVDYRLDFLRSCDGSRKIVAVDVILGRLIREGIRIDLLTAVDPKEQLYYHLEGLEEKTGDIPLLANRLAGWHYLEAYQGDVCLMTPTNTVPDFGEDGEDWDIGGTVSSLALEAAIRFGAKTIWLVGLDLAYPKDRKFAEGTAHHRVAVNESSEVTQSVTGEEVPTTRTFSFFRSQIEMQIAAHPEIRFINCSKDGAMIAGTEIME